MPTKRDNDIKVFVPVTASDTEEIILYIKNSPCIVSIKNTRKNHRQRVIDILLGASVMGGIKICDLDGENYLFTKE